MTIKCYSSTRIRSSLIQASRFTYAILTPTCPELPAEETEMHANNERVYSTGQRKVKRVPRNLRVYYAGTRLFYAECGDSLRV